MCMLGLFYRSDDINTERKKNRRIVWHNDLEESFLVSGYVSRVAVRVCEKGGKQQTAKCQVGVVVL